MGGRPVAAVFLVVLVSVVGFGIVIPLLPFYAESPVWGNGPIGLAGGGVAYATVAAGLPGLAARSRRWPEPEPRGDDGREA